MDGYDVARRFRAHASLRDVYLIALTGWGLEDDQRRSYAAGFDLHLTKPMFPDQLEAVLIGVARKRSAAQGFLDGGGVNRDGVLDRTRVSAREDENERH